MLQLNPYLNFDGQTEEAFRFYETVFGGELQMQKMSMAPGTENLSEEEKGRIMHASLSLPNGQILMGSDIVPSFGHTLSMGNNHYNSIQAESQAQADRLFDALSAEGVVEMEMADTFWGDYFGSFKDKYGVYWMISYALKS